MRASQSSGAAATQRATRALWLAAAAGAASGASAERQPPLPVELWRVASTPGVCAGAYPEAAGNTNPKTGIVSLRQGGRWLTTHAAQMSQAGVARVDTALDYGERGLRLRAEGAEVDMQNGDVRAREVDWVLTTLSLRGHAARLRKTGDRLHLRTAALTRCPPKSKAWDVRAGDVVFDAERSVVKARHVRVHIAKVPIVYVPYARFPVGAERASGFLFPEIRHERDSGLDFALPYYLHLASNYDATVALRHIRRRGTGLEAEFRHLGAGGRSHVNAAHLPADRSYNGTLARDDYLAQGGDPAAFVRADRWLLGVRHRARRGDWTTAVDFGAASDNDYFKDMRSTLALTSQAALRQRAAVRFARRGFRAHLSAHGAQRLEPGAAAYRRWPDVGVFHGGSLGPLDWTAGASWASFRVPSAANRAHAAVEGGRLHLASGLRLPVDREWGFLALALGARHTRYRLDDHRGADPRPRRDILLGSIDGGLRFERDLRGGRWLQTLEPRLRYFRQTHADQDHLPVFDTAPLTFSFDQLFRDNRFAGLDRIGDAEELAFGVVSRLRDGDGRERLTARLGALARLRSARVALPNAKPPPRSALAGDLGTAFGNLRLGATWAWDAERAAIHQTGFGLAYRKDEARLVNVGYRRRADAGVEQTDISFHWAVTPRWRLFGRWNHDWGFGQMIEGFAGIGYADCCLEVKVLGHKTLEAARASATAGAETDRGVLVEIVLRGLGGVGDGVDSRLARAIRGFRPSPPR